MEKMPGLGIEKRGLPSVIVMSVQLDPIQIEEGQ